MADLRITELPSLAGADLDGSDPIAVADLSASETKKLTAANLINEGVSRLLSDGVLPGAKLVSGSVTATQLASNSVDTAELINGAVTYAKLQNVSATDRLLGRSTAGAGVVEEITCTAAGRALLDDATASDQRTTLGLGALATKSTIGTTDLDAGSVTAAKLAGGITTSLINEGQITTALLADSAITNIKIADSTIAYGKLNLADGSIPAVKIAANSLTADQISANAIGSSELADNSVDTAAIQSGAVTNDKVATGISGSKISDNSLDGSALIADSVTGDKIAPAAVNRGLDLVGNSIGHTNTVSPGTANGISFDSQGHITGTTSLASSDLPAATTTNKGAVSIPASSGLSVSGAGVVSHSASITGSTVSGITFNDSGHITAASPLSSADIPVATNAALGGVIVSGSSLSVDGGGNLSHDTSGVNAGTYTKVTVDTRGHVTAAQQLVAGDIPSLDASKITSGTLSGDRIADGVITAAKIADAGLSKVSGAGQFPQPDFLGQFLYSATGILYFAVGTSLSEYMWMPVNDQASLNKQVRWGGTWNADTGKLVAVTSFGTQAGLSAGQDLPPPDETGVAGLYFICTTAGTGTGYAPALPFDVGDWVLSLGTSWLRIDVITGGTGTLNADQILLSPGVGSYVAAQDAIEGLHALTQIATDSTLGVIKSSTSIDVNAVTGVATVDVVDDGTY